MRAPEHPVWTLMLTHHATIVHVRQEFADEKTKLGWIIVARESDILPFNTPRLITGGQSQEGGA